MVSRVALLRASCHLLLSALACVLLAAALGHAQAAEGRIGEWQRRLGQVEARLRRLPASDTAGQERLAGDLSMLRQEVGAFLATFPPAQGDRNSWLEESVSTATIQELAAEVGRLRSALSRIAAAGGGVEGGGAFYLGRVDVAVTAETTASATTEMTPAGASVLTAADLQANDRGALAGALSLAPGVTFTRRGRTRTGTGSPTRPSSRRAPIRVTRRAIRPFRWPPAKVAPAHRFHEEYEHNGGASAYAIVAVRVKPLPKGTRDIDWQTAAARALAERQIVFFGALEGR